MKTVYIAGHNGMVGSALVRCFQRLPNVKIVTRSRAELDLTNQAAVAEFFAITPIDEVYLAAAKVGGISANNQFPADFIYQNLIMECNLIHAAHQHDVQRLLFLGSSCIYPRLAPQPMTEDALLTGPLEPTNEPYAVAKIAGIKMCESYNRQHDRDYRSVMPTNLYGPNDNYHPENSHVIPGLIRRFHAAKRDNEPEVIAWGTGTPMREFLHVDDMASACLHVMQLEKPEFERHTQPMLSHINVGSGKDCTIRELVETIADVVDYQGEVVWDTSKPDGAPKKLMDSSRLRSLGWTPHYELKPGLKDAYRWYVDTNPG